MIILNEILQEMPKDEVKKLLDKIKQKQFSFFDKGDNGRIYEITGTDFLFKITTETEEYRVAEVIVGRHSEFSTFIPVHYVDGRNMYIMNKAERLPESYRNAIDRFHESYKEFAKDQGGEVSIFDFLDADGARDTDVKLVNFLRALQRDVQRTGVSDFDLELDFKADNIMLWNGNMVMIDW
jgi:hypothetical protein